MSDIYARISQASKQDIPRLFEVWESSVRATHRFLSEADINMLIPLARAEIENFIPIYCLRESDGRPFAMLGMQGSKIDMLFIHPDHRGNGAGRLLVEFAIEKLGADSVDVNEQNTSAVGFYQRLGFYEIGRSSLDACGNPFPILHLALQPDQMVMHATKFCEV